MMSRTVISVSGLLFAILVAFYLSLTVGAVDIPFQTVLNTLFDRDGDQQQFIINRSRLPRSLLAIVTGGALALSGVIIQALLRNPLASPKIIGINSGAALAVLLATLLAPSLSYAWFPVIAALGGVIAASVVYLLAELRSVSAARLALVGIAVGMTADAGVDFLLVTADSYAVSAPLVWLTGSLWGRGWSQLAAVWPQLVVLILLCLAMAHRLDLIRLGDTQAMGLGVNVRVERFVLLGLATGLASISVSAVGVLGFIGLMAPHIARKLVGGQHAAVLPVAMLTGALLVVLADAAGRALMPPIEVSAGILTAMFGAPFFIFLLLTTRSERT